MARTRRNPIFFLILLCFWVESVSFANSIDRTCLSEFLSLTSKNRTEIQFEYKGEPLTSRQAQEIKKLIWGINEMLPPELLPPNPLRIETASQMKQPPSLLSMSSLRTPYQYRSPDGRTKHPKFTQAILAHEYGHLVFLQSLGQHSPLGKRLHDLADSLPKIEAKKKILQSKNSAIRDELEGRFHDLTLEERKTLQLRKETVLTEISELAETERATNAEIGNILDSFASYNELFADLVSVLYFRDGKIVSQATSFTGEKLPVRHASQALKKKFEEHIAKTSYRDFTRSHETKGWNENDDPHYILSPVRSFLGEEYLKKPAWLDNRSALLRQVFFSIRDEIEAANQNLIKEKSAEVLSRRLIDRIGTLPPPRKQE